ESSTEYAILCSSQSADILQVFSSKQTIGMTRYAANRMRINKVKFSNDGTRVLFASEDRTAGQVYLSGATKPVIYKEHRSSVIDVAVSADNKFIVTGSGDGGIRVWSAEADAPLATFGDVSHVLAKVVPRSVAISPDGKYAVSAMSDHSIRVWD